MDGSTMARIKVAAEPAVASVDPLTLRHAAGEIRIAAALIGVQLTGDVLQQVRDAFGHLAAAASGPDGRQAGELRQARAAATRLITGRVREVPAKGPGGCLLAEKPLTRAIA